MDKRQVPRYKRRIQLRFWSADDKKPRQGFTQNISVMGMFVSTNAPFKPRDRVYLEIPSGQDKLVFQAKVRYSARVDPALQKVKLSGMGVRLLRVDEVMSELLKLKAEGVEVTTEPDRTADVVADEPSELAGTVFPVTYETPHDLVRSYRRDIKYGGLFIASTEPEDQNEHIVVEFRFGWDSGQVVRVEALVVKRFAAAEGSLTGESVAGMGVAFSDPADVITQFNQVLSGLEES
jgi:Tfp pilus assembly protein PilZ